MLNHGELDAVRAAGHGVWRWNTLTSIVFFSREWKEMLGYSESEIDNHLDEWASRVHPDDLDRCSANLTKMLGGDKGEYRCVHRIKHKDGNYIWILDMGKPVEWDNNGKPLTIIGTHTEVTDIIENAKKYLGEE